MNVVQQVEFYALHNFASACGASLIDCAGSSRTFRRSDGKTHKLCVESKRVKSSEALVFVEWLSKEKDSVSLDAVDALARSVGCKVTRIVGGGRKYECPENDFAALVLRNGAVPSREAVYLVAMALNL